MIQLRNALVTIFFFTLVTIGTLHFLPHNGDDMPGGFLVNSHSPVTGMCTSWEIPNFPDGTPMQCPQPIPHYEFGSNVGF